MGTTKLLLLDSLLQEIVMYLSSLLRAADHPYLFGKGGRNGNNARMAGMTLATLKHHTAIQPLFFIMACGITFVAAYCGRLALKGHDVNFSKKKDPLDPMSYYTNKQFKMFNPTNYDYSTANTAHIEANKYKE